MRDILFRGKRIDNGQWVQGYYFQIWEKGYILWGTTNGIPNMIEVDPETVGQYTWLHDKNERKIFEGDIIGYYETHDCGCYPHDEYEKEKVVFKRGCFQPFNRRFSDPHIIGNIHDRS